MSGNDQYISTSCLVMSSTSVQRVSGNEQYISTVCLAMSSTLVQRVSGNEQYISTACLSMSSTTVCPVCRRGLGPVSRVHACRSAQHTTSQPTNQPTNQPTQAQIHHHLTLVHLHRYCSLEDHEAHCMPSLLLLLHTPISLVGWLVGWFKTYRQLL